MKRIAHQTSSTVLALIILFSTLSFTVDKHYCGDYLVAVSIFSKAEDCGMDMLESISENDCDTIKTTCCKNEATYVKGNDVEQQAIQQIEIEQLTFVAVFVNSYVSLFDEKVSDNFAFHYYKPPLIQKDVQVLFENFRI